MPRHAELTVVAGRRKTGKTNQTLTQLFKAVMQHNRKVLIFDPTDEFGDYQYRDNEPRLSIKPIFIRDIPRFSVQMKAEIVRIKPYFDDGRRMSTDDMANVLSIILQSYRNGIMLIEDINKYVTDNPRNDLMGSLATLRQNGVDLIAHYQMIGKAGNPKILGMTNYIRMHKTADQVARHEDKFLDKTQILSISENIVNARFRYGVQKKVYNYTGTYFSCLVDMEALKIDGVFTQKEAEKAVEQYISHNSANTIRSEYNSLDRTGKRVWKDYASCYAYVERNMMEDYFDF